MIVQALRGEVRHASHEIIRRLPEPDAAASKRADFARYVLDSLGERLRERLHQQAGELEERNTCAPESSPNAHAQHTKTDRRPSCDLGEQNPRFLVEGVKKTKSKRGG